MQFHEANHHEAVEPRVRQRLHRLLETLTSDAFFQCLTFPCDCSGERFTSNNSNIALFDDWFSILCRKTVERRAVSNSLDEFFSRLRGIGFQLRSIHSITYSLTDLDTLIIVDGCF